MAGEITEKQVPPILVAAFKEESQLLSALASLEEQQIGRDFIGVFVGEAAFGVNGGHPLHLLSVLAPRRLHDEIRGSFSSSGAEAVGGAAEMQALYRTIPHPGALDYYDMKLPMGAEYPQARRNNGNGAQGRRE
ncbi:MAG: hypothetical protein Q8P22_14530 [Chloroflexota bacterium]|nr:hypothetical protein [Chloroflexota bacterium]